MRRASETVLTDLRVLAIDQRTAGGEGKPAPGKTVTLEVTPKQVEDVAVAGELGKLSLSLRSLATENPIVASRGRGLTWDSDVSAVAGRGFGATGEVQVVHGGKTEAVPLKPGGMVAAPHAEPAAPAKPGRDVPVAEIARGTGARILADRRQSAPCRGARRRRGAAMSARSVRAALWALALGTALVAAPRPAAHGAEVIGVSGPAIKLDGNKGELVRLSRPAATVFIADPDIADVQVKSPRLIYVFGKKPGETTLYAVDAQEQVLLSRTISVTQNLAGLRDALKRMLPDAAIDASSVDGTIVLSGSVSNARDADEARKLARQLVKDDASLVNHLSVTAPNQVQLRVRVAEVRRDVLKTLGINWDAIVGVGKFAFGLATGNPVLAGGALLGGGARNFVTRNIVGTQNTNSVFGGFRSGSADINAVVDALDNEGLITVLAEPNLTAVSGEQATFLAGGEFPILVPDDNNRVTVQFKQFGVSLGFKPVLVGDNRITLKVSPEVSQLSNTGAVTINNFQIPALTTRRAQTTVQLGSGQSFVIAGLLQNNVTHSLNKLPGLADLPVLGPLFRSDQFQRNESELVIIVTPYVVRPIVTSKVASPTDGLIPPTDVDRILFGRMQHPAAGTGRGRVVGAGGEGLVGPVGYVLD